MRELPKAAVCFFACLVAMFFSIGWPGCGSDKPDEDDAPRAVDSMETGPASSHRIENMSRTQKVKTDMNRIMDKKADDRSQKMDEIFE